MTFTAAQLQGLESLFLKYPIDLRLVSDGAECIFVSKKLFLRVSTGNTKVLQQISEQVSAELAGVWRAGV